MHNNSPEVDRHFDAHTRADARFASTFICQIIGDLRRGDPIDGESLALRMEALMHTCYSSPEPDLEEGLRARANMLMELAGGMTKLPVERSNGAEEK